MPLPSVSVRACAPSGISTCRIHSTVVPASTTSSTIAISLRPVSNTRSEAARAGAGARIMEGAAMKTLIRLAAAGLLSAPAAWGAVSPEEAARLGAELTPLGGETAANADGSIPAWTGGLKSASDAGFPSYHSGDHYPDPYANDKPLFTITAANLGQYAAKVTEGHKALFKTYPDYKMVVYPTHRSAAAPERVYEATKRNATTAKLAAGGNGVTGAPGGRGAAGAGDARSGAGSAARVGLQSRPAPRATRAERRLRQPGHELRQPAHLRSAGHLQRQSGALRLEAGREEGDLRTLQRLPPAERDAQVRRSAAQEPHQSGPGALRAASRVGGGCDAQARREPPVQPPHAVRGRGFLADPRRGLLRHARAAVSRAGRARDELLRPADALAGPGAGHGPLERALSRARTAERGAEVLRLQYEAYARRLSAERAGAARNPLGSRGRERKKGSSGPP